MEASQYRVILALPLSLKTVISGTMAGSERCLAVEGLLPVFTQCFKKPLVEVHNHTETE